MQCFRTLLQHANSTGSNKPLDSHRQFILDLQVWIEMHQSEVTSIILCLAGNKEVELQKSINIHITWTMVTIEQGMEGKDP
jgi:hypothetical protein